MVEGVVVRPRVLQLRDVVSHTVTLSEGESALDVMDAVGSYFKSVLMQNGYYTSGPIVFSYLPGGDRFTVMTSLGNEVNIVDDSEQSFGFLKELRVESDYFYRHCDVAEPIPYDLLFEKVSESGRAVSTVYHVVLDVFGDVMLDLYVEPEQTS
ncbi:hypothetical protein G7067_07005 [Leucobacter insecticola]|uniref:DUF5085 family protein n=1 Tax=Leucobacter insecticola TaxID=2714934 RepID=A0A6G8FIW4_9MICO|nr:hypothetical protein [Leucobacter insecticola]QIM16229.1 hypothetical protein G7067_07005 [Leucobacter insecticola]